MNQLVVDAVGAEALLGLVPEIVDADAAAALPLAPDLVREERTASIADLAIVARKTARVIVLEDVRRTVRGQEASQVTARNPRARNDPYANAGTGTRCSSSRLVVETSHKSVSAICRIAPPPLCGCSCFRNPVNECSSSSLRNQGVRP